MAELTPRGRHFLEALHFAINQGRTAESERNRLIGIFPEYMSDIEEAWGEVVRMRESKFEEGTRNGEFTLRQKPL